MYRFLITALVALVFTARLFSQQITIDDKNRVANCGAGYCGHCCLETIARHHGYANMAGHVNGLYTKFGEYGGFLREDQLCEWLTYSGMKYVHFYMGGFRYDWIEWACNNKCPCIVQLNVVGRPMVTHSVVLVGFYDSRVALIDSNKPHDVRWMSRIEFSQYWNGSLAVVYPKDERILREDANSGHRVNGGP